jgi:glyceraldehyde 3-phosphate dehydrogenase
MKKRIAINGFGRIGRTVLKLSLLAPYNEELEIVAVNDLGDVNNLAYLVKYDSVYGTIPQEVMVIEREGKPYIKIDSQEILVCSEKDPSNLPWASLGIDVVIESTGFFTSTEKSQAHINAGAKRVVISAPTKDDTLMVTPALNEEALRDVLISSNASCTTNATNPVASIIHEALGIEKALLSTVHAYTATQSLVDGMADPSDLRRGRAGAQNITPSTTGAAKAVSKVIPDLTGKFDGVAIRVPVIAGSLIDLTMLVSRDTTVEEINQILTNASQSEKWQGILGVTNAPLVSTDILKSSYGSLVALDLTQVVDGDLIKVMAWYDNEWSYTSMLMRHVSAVLKLLE